MEEILAIKPSRKYKKNQPSEGVTEEYVPAAVLSASGFNGRGNGSGGSGGGGSVDGRNYQGTGDNGDGNGGANGGGDGGSGGPWLKNGNGHAQTSAAAKRASVLGERIYKDNEAHLLPRISFDSTQNIVAWTHARLVMQNFGERFHFRLSLYVICAMFMLVMFMLLGLLHMGTADDRLQLFFTPWFMQTLLSVTMVIGFLALIMQTGSCVNATLELHSEAMSAHALRVYRKITQLRLDLQQLKESAANVGSFTAAGAAAAEAALAEREACIGDEIANLQEVLETLEDMKQVVETNTQIKPFKVFGFTAQSSLTMSILTTAFSFYAILVSLLFKTDSQALTAVGM
jgi:hypothetical protein